MRLIDADALVEEIQSVYVEEKSEDPKWAIGLRYSKHIVRNMPTVEQQPKTGHWLKKMASCPSAIAMGGSKISACDLCGGWGKKTFQYCPHCGAKMEKQP